jgi:hypothetical protein
MRHIQRSDNKNPGALAGAFLVASRVETDRHHEPLAAVAERLTNRFCQLLGRDGENGWANLLDFGLSSSFVDFGLSTSFVLVEQVGVIAKKLFGL